MGLTYWKLQKFKKGTILIKEGEYQPQIFLINQGKAAIYKKVNFQSDQGEKITKNELITLIESGDILGEEKLWYDRENTYEIKVVSQDFQAYTISHEDFEKNFGKVIEFSKEQFDTRHKFIEQRCKILEK